MSQKRYEDLIGKMAVAADRLRRSKRGHSNRCIVELDPESYAPCSCGATAYNAAIDEAIKELKP